MKSTARFGYTSRMRRLLAVVAIATLGSAGCAKKRPATATSPIGNALPAATESTSSSATSSDADGAADDDAGTGAKKSKKIESEKADKKPDPKPDRKGDNLHSADPCEGGQ